MTIVSVDNFRLKPSSQYVAGSCVTCGAYVAYYCELIYAVTLASAQMSETSPRNRLVFYSCVVSVAVNQSKDSMYSAHVVELQA